VLSAAIANPAEPSSLQPTSPELLIDSEYLLYAAGLLASVEPEAAFALAANSLQRVENGDCHGPECQIA
jgi:hypothetical protein